MERLGLFGLSRSEKRCSRFREQNLSTKIKRASGHPKIAGKRFTVRKHSLVGCRLTLGGIRNRLMVRSEITHSPRQFGLRIDPHLYENPHFDRKTYWNLLGGYLFDRTTSAS